MMHRTRNGSRGTPKCNLHGLEITIRREGGWAENLIPCARMGM
jgi:hypothetical protein